MTTIQPTVLDVSRAIAVLSATDHGAVLETADARRRVASNLAFQFSRHYGAGGRKNVTARDVRFVLMANGMMPGPLVDKDAKAIAAFIRADFSDGWRYHEGISA